MASQRFSQPPWGAYIERERKSSGRSQRQLAQVAGMSGAYLGQIERGYQESNGVTRPIKPSRAKLLEVAEALRLSTAKTDELLGLAGYPASAGSALRPERGDYVDLTGLKRRDVSLLKAIADRLREDPAVEKPLRLRPAARRRNEKPPERS